MPTASRKEEASLETLMLVLFVGDRPSDRRLSHSSQAIQPEDALLVLAISLSECFLKNVNAGLWETSGFVLPLIRVEGRLIDIR